ncbi:MAG: hypothetical protein KJ621_06355 [Proteobacteria bacterium]|nr:hypothetical protein [Pseudomonadota bacterium]MBU1742453.1 hypothetical protein [Pseudomonadota bacterium]
MENDRVMACRCPTAELFEATRRMLIEIKGFRESDLTTNVPITPDLPQYQGPPFVIDFLINLSGRPAAIVVCAPGWISNLARAATAAARLLAETVIPLSVVTNGDQVEVVDNLTGQVVGYQLADLPDRDQMAARLAKVELRTLSRSRREKEGRIMAAFQGFSGGACG